MNWQMQPSSNASVVPGAGIMFIDSGEAVRIDGSLARYGGGLINDFRNVGQAHAAAQPA
jgi:hypothetical protein